MMEFVNLIAILLLFCTSIIAQSIGLYNFTTTASGFSSTCVAVLNTNVTCDSSIEWAGANHRYEDDQTLKNLCTATCAKSLSDWLRRVTGACTTRFITSSGDAILPAYWVERVIERYSVTCQQNENEFCNAVLRDEIGVNPEDQKVTKSPIPSSVTCNDCFLKQIQTQLQMPLSSNPDLASTFTSLTNQCSKTGFVVTPPATTTQFITKATPPTTSSMVPSPTGCVGSTYSLKSTDTCQSVSSDQGLSTADLLTANGLQAYCEKFPTAGSLCIPTNAKCKTYTIKSGDSCVSIADAHQLTFVQFVTWNPIVGQTCSLIDNLAGWTSCVSNPGGSWINPSPTSSTESQTPSPTNLGTDANLLPQPTFGGAINGSDIWTYTYAERTRLDCYLYANGSQFGPSASCVDVAKGYGVTTQNLTDWNPSLLGNSCMLDGKQTYCVMPMHLNATKQTEFCVMTDAPEYGDTCADFIASWGINVTDFAAWNPGVGSQCENWLLGRDYCVMVRHFRQPGIVSTCNQYAMCNESNILDDPCGMIETKFGLQHGRFVAWNPSVGQNCTGIMYGYDYCVSIPGYKPTYTTPTVIWPTTFTVPTINVPNPTTLPAPISAPPH